MKKGMILLFAAQMALVAGAQEKQTNTKTGNYADSLLQRWCIDANFMAGGLSQSMTLKNTAGDYLNSVASNTNTGSMKFSNGSSVGGEFQLGYFFGKKRHFGIGLGILYVAQQADVTLSGYHVQFQTQDGNTASEVISANNDIKETLKISNFNIPVLLKYKKRFSKHWGFTADAGAVINLQMKNAYTTNGTFDYSGPNFGVGVTPTSKTGNVSYTTGSIGLLISPAVSYYLSDHVAINLGVHYMFQPFKNSVSNSYQLTNNVGDYSSMLNGVSAVNSSTYGANLGVRIFFGKPKDTDHDGVPDKKDLCPDVYGLKQFQGCPDRDGDGIPDKDDLCPDVKGLAQFHGCPDTDGDGIPDKDDACPYQAGPVALHGCPDRDGDGIADKDDLCPDKKGLAQFHGCPDTDGDGIPDNEDNCPDVAGPASNHGCPIPPPPPAEPEMPKNIAPILFQTNKTVITKTSIPTIEEAAQAAKENKDAVINVDGYTDNTGSKSYNKKLSIKRATAVKKKLTKLGVDPKKVKISGHGEASPVESNKTKEGRMKNRRAVMELETGK